MNITGGHNEGNGAVLVGKGRRREGKGAMIM